MYLDFEKTKGKLETVLDTYQMKIEHHKKIKKRSMVYLLQLALHLCTLSASRFTIPLLAGMRHFYAIRQ